ncbi:MAG TPA: hypothetical protein VLM37_11255 [Fibrobacteraceae bacterium]|nr:hypothetical protein [Fibrobacteraceae bacterium]
MRIKGLQKLALVCGVFLSCPPGVFAYFGDGTDGTDSIPDALLEYGLFGEEWDSIGYEAKTSSYGVVGSDGYVYLSQGATIRGDLISLGQIIGNSNNTIGAILSDTTISGSDTAVTKDTVEATVSANGKISFINVLDIVAGSIYTPDSISLNGAGGGNVIHGKTKTGAGIVIGANNTFTDTLTTVGSKIYANAYQSNTFGNQTVNMSSRDNLNAIEDDTLTSVKWSTDFECPSDYEPTGHEIPRTTLFVGDNNCTTPANGYWNPTYCDSTVSSVKTTDAKYYLPPGSYGSLTMGYNSRIVLGEGIYYFKSIYMTGNTDSILVYQPSGARTQIFVQDTLQFNYMSALVPYDTADNEGGTILLYYGGTASMVVKQSNVIWATIIAPDALVRFQNSDSNYYSKAYLYGQVFAKQLWIGQDYEGNDGRYIPFYPTKPTVGVVSSGGNTITEGDSGSKAFPVSFTLDHENGLLVTVYFHTQSRAAGDGNADSLDYVGVSDSVVFAIGDTVASYNGILVNGDETYEPDEYFDLVIDSVINADSSAVGTSYALGILNDDDPPLADDMVTSYSVAEPDTGKTTIKIPIVLAGASVEDIPWSIIVSSASSVSSGDYTLTVYSGVIEAGSLSDTIVVAINSDIYDEPDEQLILVFDTTAGATDHVDLNGKDTITVTILDNDGPVAKDDSVSVMENVPAGTSVEYLENLYSAQDTTATYTWTLLDTLDASIFQVAYDSSAGWILQIKDSTAFDYEAADHVFDVILVISGTYHCDTAHVVISVTNEEESPFAPAADTILIYENTAAGTSVDTILPEEYSGSGLVWTIVGGTGTENFVVTTTSSGAAIITVKDGAVLDYEADSVQTLTLILTNQSKYSDTTQVLILIQNVLEYSEVEITQVVTADDSVYTNPDTIWINNGEFDMSWTYDGQDTAEIVTITQDGETLVIRSYCDSTKDFCGVDTLVVRLNTTDPDIEWDDPDPTEDTVPKYTVVEQRDPGDTIIYVNNSDTVITGTVTYVDSSGDTVSIPFTGSGKLVEGEVATIYYTFTDPYGNTVTDSIAVMLDTVAPVVEIVTPEMYTTFYTYTADVVWTVDGVIMDTLNLASLQEGENWIVRSYMDLAGNVGTDSVLVYLELTGNNISINLTSPLVEPTEGDLTELASDYPNHNDNETFSFTVVNQTTMEEEELAWGESGSSIYPTESDAGFVYESSVDNHVGPTLAIEVKFQQVGGLNAEGESRGGTLADLLEWADEEGVSSDEVLCGESMPSDPDSVALWNNSLKLTVEIYDNIGQFLDNFTVKVDSIGSDYLNNDGFATFYFTLEPDQADGLLKDSRGRVYGNGAYILRGLVKAVSTYQFCAGEYEKGDQIKSSANLLKIFGYRRLE